MLVAIIAAHVGAIYALGYAFAPDLTRSIERDVLAAFDLAPAPPAEDPPPPPTAEPEPDEGAQGDPGRLAVPAPVTVPVTAPPPRLPRPTPTATPRPPVAATGTASSAGAREEGEGTGAAGPGQGTGSGNRGSGRGNLGGGGAVTRPEHISGAINNARDYPIPPGGREARRGSEVIVKVIVGVDGRARDCSIYKASADPEADRITCRLVEERLGFRPALDASGTPVPAAFYWRQRWF